MRHVHDYSLSVRLFHALNYAGLAGALGVTSLTPRTAGVCLVGLLLEFSNAGPAATTSISPSSASVAENPVPLVNQPLVPGAVKPGGAGFTLTVTGTGFVSGATVHWNLSLIHI